MCGRYTLILLSDLLEMAPWIEPPPAPVPARYNIAPTQPVAAITNLESRVQFLRWGLIPAWANDPAIGSRMINARAETLNQKPALAKLLKSQRCLIPADGFFEWMPNPDGKSKSPHYIGMKRRTPFAFAGLWDTWRKRGGLNDETITSCTIITVRANSLVQPIHNRMPAILAEKNFRQWLSGEIPSANLLEPYPADEMEAFTVSDLVNSPRNDVPAVIEPVVEHQGNLFG